MNIVISNNFLGLRNILVVKILMCGVTVSCHRRPDEEAPPSFSASVVLLLLHAAGQDWTPEGVLVT